MSAVQLIHQCRDAGIRLQARGDRLHVEAPRGVVTPELRQQLAEHKADLLDQLGIRVRLLVLAKTLAIPRAVVDALTVEDLEATAEQVTLCDGHSDGHGDPLPHSLLVFYLRELAGRIEA